MSGEVPVVTRPGRPLTGFAGAHFLPAADSPVHAILLSAGAAPLILLPSLSARGGTGLQGPGSLDC